MKHLSGNKARGQRGHSLIVILVIIVLMPVCALALSYVCEFLGWIVGHIVDWIPLVNKVAPWMAERCGLHIKSGNLNVDLYQTVGAINGFWTGLWLPWKVVAKLVK